MGFTGVLQEDAYPVEKAKEEVKPDENIYEATLRVLKEAYEENFPNEEMNSKDADEVTEIKFTYCLDPTKNILIDGKPISEYHKKEDIENADEKPETKSVDACKQAKTRKRVRRKNPKRKKTTKKSKKKEVSDGV